MGVSIGSGASVLLSFFVLSAAILGLPHHLSFHVELI
jgi:hypothetical protein